FYEFYPEKFNNKKNGIAHRRWVMKAKPQLTNLISEAIGTEWKKEPIKLQELQLVQYDASFQEKFAEVKQGRKEILAEHIHNTMGITIDPNSIFDGQVK
ncbi:glycogen/starch/alpha-glucan phosphorylase, partial [Bacillus tropicus]|uniref:glycogen/starch/alpha-glucan phosphorylase n=1 Tax=Bacillus tropicus TaxID=2026188 RepID=UPI00283BC89D